jgi:hypothetical protein
MIISNIIQNPIGNYYEAGIYVQSINVHVFSGKFQSKELAQHTLNEKMLHFAKLYLRKICNIHIDYCVYNSTIRYLDLCQTLTHAKIPQDLPEVSKALKEWKVKEKEPLIDYDQAIQFCQDYGVFILINSKK